MRCRAGLLVVVLLAATTVVVFPRTAWAVTTPTFGSRTDYGTGFFTNPFAVAVGDLNGDGHSDFVEADNSTNVLEVWTNNGSGSFTENASYSTGTGSAPYGVAIGDFNGDGHPDIAVAEHGSNVVAVYFNNGSGVFTLNATYATGSAPYALAVGDFNGDGHPDIAVANSSSNTVSILMNNGDGTFASKVDYTTGTSPQSVAVGDFNGDGHPDIAVANSSSNTVSILMNNGSGTFASKVDYTTGTGPRSVAVGDFNGDGHSDLAVADNGASTVSVFVNNGNGTFASKVDYTTGSGPVAVAVGDFNSDGRLDLAVANSVSSTVSVLTGNGNGTFNAKTDFGTAAGPNDMKVADLNGDGRLDIVVADGLGGAVSVLPNTTLAAPTITSASSTTFISAQASTFTVAAAGYPTPTLTKSGTLPSGVTFVDNGNGTATLSGTTSATGTYSLTITAHNSSGSDATQTFTLTVATASWYNANWLYRKSITIDHTKVGAVLTNFPFLVSITDSGLAAKAQSSGNDILFTAADGVTKLNHQIGSYVSATGTLTGWVNVPTVSNTTDTVVYLYYGNASAANQQNATGVWDANYTGVWHMNDSPNSSAGNDISDSTSAANTGSSKNMTSANSTTGQIGNAITFNGTNQEVDTTNKLSNPQVFTAQAWFKTSTAAGQKILGFEDVQTGTATVKYDRLIWVGTDGQLRGALYDGTTNHYVNYGTNVVDGHWHDVAITYDSSTTSFTLYVDGTARSTTTSPSARVYNGWWRMGAYKVVPWTNGVDGYFPGVIDEVRTSSVARSSGWMSTEYANQNSPSTFSTLGTEQRPPAITSASSTTFTASQASTFTVTTTGTPTPTLTESGTLPSGVTFVDNGNGTATLSGTTSATGTYSLTITANNSSGNATQTFVLSVRGWYNTSWLYRKSITIDHTKVGAVLTGFPFLVSITDSGLAAKAQSSGNDILFTSSDGVTKLSHEIESYVSGTGTLVAWVGVPTVSNTTDTVVYLYYGNASAANQQNATGVWDANYAGVWHLAEGPTGTAPQFEDSTNNANDGTAQGAIPAGAQVAGKIDGSITLDGVANYISTTNQGTVPNNDTVEAWFKTTTASGKKIIGYEDAQTGTTAANYDRMLWVGTDGQLRFGMYDGALEIAPSGTTVTDGGWHLAVGVEDNTAHILYLYVDGALASSVATGTTPQSYTGYWRIGSYMMYSGWTNSAAGYFPGGIDELRASTIARSSGWISTEYKNESSPSTFSTLGTEQGTPTISSANNATFTAGQAGTFTVTAGGTPTPTIAESGTLPSGVTFVDNGNGTATLAGTPKLNGTYPLTITAHNTSGPDATQAFTLTVAAGSLSMSVPASANLGSGVVGTTVSGQFGTVQVTDNRGSATAAWTATVSSTTFTKGGSTVPLANVKYWSGAATATTGTGTFTPGQATSGAAQGLTTARTAFTLSGGNGTNNASWNPTLVVTIPLTVVAGTYTGTITHSVA